MDNDQGVAHKDLPRLKMLAGDFLASEHPDPAVLDEMSVLAAAVAAHCREQARQELLGLVAEGARAILPSAGGDIRTRLAQSSHAELSSLGMLLDDVNRARTAFSTADSGLMTARDRGDYAAMVPLAMEAENQKKALDAATAEFTSRIGGSATPPTTATPGPDRVEPDQPSAPSGPGEPTSSAEDSPMLLETVAEPAGDSEATGETPTGRRRIRDLIRQVRSTPDELPAR